MESGKKRMNNRSLGALVIIVLLIVIEQATGTSCETCPSDYGWCPTTRKCIKGTYLGPTEESCPSDPVLGQYTYYKRNCKCLTATACSDIDGTDCGWCPSAKKAYINGSNGPAFGLRCNATAEDGQWTTVLRNCACLTAKSCLDIENTNCGWCPSRGKAYQGDEYKPSDGIDCPADQDKGQWTYGTRNCKCLTATSCYDIDNTYCGWCPSTNRAYIGTSTGPKAPLTCPPDPDKGQWTYDTRNCPCLTAKTCYDLQNTNCGWCPSRGKAYLGDEYKPADGIECPADQDKGQWTYGQRNCKCLYAKGCLDIENTNCGWCPATQRAYIGSYNGPKAPLECPADPDKGQWTIDTKNCKCLTAKNCTDIENTNCGWCPSKGRAYIGDEYKPADNLACPADADKGQWTWNIKNCKCLTARNCKDIENTNCGWCPATQRAYLGNYNGPNTPLTCNADPDKGQWTIDTKNCKCLTAKNCTDIYDTDCGWCPSSQKAYLGDYSGPTGLSCPADYQKGQWTKYMNNCKCLTAKSCTDITGTGCGWCPVTSKAYIGDSYGPTGLDCAASVDKGQWTLDTRNCKCLNASSVDSITGTNCGWCPIFQKAYIGEYNGPTNLQCPADISGQWTFGKEAIKCYKAKSCSEIASSYNCGWCINLKQAYQGDYNGPYGVTCPAGWIYRSSDCWKGVPSVIVDLAIVAVTADTITVTWTKPNSNGFDITNYKLEFSYFDSSTHSIVTHSQIIYPDKAGAYTLQNLLSETTYNLTILTKNAVGCSDSSNAVLSTTLRNIVFADNVQGMYTGRLDENSYDCTGKRSSNISLVINYNSIIFNNKADSFVKCSSKGNAYYQCIRNSTSIATCLLLDTNAGQFSIQMGTDPACPFILPQQCTLDHYQNVTSSRIVNQKLNKPASFGNTMNRFTYTGYNDDCVISEDSTPMIVTFSTNKITIRKQSTTIEDIRHLTPDNLYSGWLNGKLVCLYTDGHSTLKIQSNAEGKCPSDQTSHAECSDHSSVSIFKQYTTKEDHAIYYMAIAGGVIIGLVILALTICLIVCCCKRRRKGYQSIYETPQNYTSILRNSRSGISHPVLIPVSQPSQIQPTSNIHPTAPVYHIN